MNIIVFMTIVIVILILALWVIRMLGAATHVDGPLVLVLQILAVLGAIYFICRRVGWTP